MAAQLSTSTAVSYSSGFPGRAILSVRDHYFVVDSPLALDGPNEEVNPVDLLLSALASCACFVFETCAREMQIPLESMSATVSADYDPRGARGGNIDPGVQVFRLFIRIKGVSAEQCEQLVQAFRLRCTVYRTLVKAAPIEIDVTIG
jgi:uncharacterized OsmC-like protein